jgi:hypothetical protein
VSNVGPRVGALCVESDNGVVVVEVSKRRIESLLHTVVIDQEVSFIASFLLMI